MKRPLAVLHIEDSENDSLLLRRHLTRAGFDVTLQRVETAEQMKSAFERGSWDVIISDYVMPNFSALAALEVAKELNVDIPFLILSGAIGEETAVSAMRAGAHDYLMKDNLARLVPAIERERQEAANRRERKRAEDALRTSEKLATLGRLAATIAHEVNNPLEAVTNVLYLLARHPGLDATAQSYIDIAEKELGRVTHIVRQALGFTRASTAPGPVDLGAVFDNVLELYRPKIELAGINVERRYDSVEPVCAVGAELRQVFSNLTVNALDALQNGGKIAIRIRKAREFAGHMRQGIRIIVADSGSGISREHLGHIFEPFFTTKGQKGTGLGLWISHNIVANHGGTIRVHTCTKAGRTGTAFSVFLPSDGRLAESDTDIAISPIFATQ